MTAADLVARLRAAAEWSEYQRDPAPDWDALLVEGANEIERLRLLLRGHCRACADEEAEL